MLFGETSTEGQHYKRRKSVHGLTGMNHAVPVKIIQRDQKDLDACLQHPLW